MYVPTDNKTSYSTRRVCIDVRVYLVQQYTWLGATEHIVEQSSSIDCGCREVCLCCFCDAHGTPSFRVWLHLSGSNLFAPIPHVWYGMVRETAALPVLLYRSTAPQQCTAVLTKSHSKHSLIQFQREHHHTAGLLRYSNSCWNTDISLSAVECSYYCSQVAYAQMHKCYQNVWDKV